MATACDLGKDGKMVCYDNGNISFVRYNDSGYDVVTLSPNEVKTVKKMLKSV